RSSCRLAILQPLRPGRHPDEVDTSHCHALGQRLARLHLETEGTDLQRRSDRGLDWMAEQASALQARSDEEARTLLGELLPMVERLRARRPALPQAVLHADLFRDNVLFEGHHLTG